MICISNYCGSFSRNERAIWRAGEEYPRKGRLNLAKVSIRYSTNTHQLVANTKTQHYILENPLLSLPAGAPPAVGPAVIALRGPIMSAAEAAERPNLPCTTADAIRAQLNMLPADASFILEIDSPGGNLREGYAIYDMLLPMRERFHTLIHGLCASVASVVAMAACRVEMTPHARLFIHNPYVEMLTGNASRLEHIAESLRREERTMIQVYTDATGMSAEEVGALMAAETELNAEEALRLGFIHAVRRAPRYMAWYKEPAGENPPAQETPKEAAAPAAWWQQLFSRRDEKRLMAENEDLRAEINLCLEKMRAQREEALKLNADHKALGREVEGLKAMLREVFSPPLTPARYSAAPPQAATDGTTGRQMLKNLRTAR